MLRIALPVTDDCGRKTFIGVLISPLATSNPAIGGVDISQRKIVVGLAEDRLGRLPAWVGVHR